MSKSEIVHLQLHEIQPYENNPRKNLKAVKAVSESLKEFGAQNPIIIDRNNVIIAGHTRYLAATAIGMDTFPCIVAEGLSDEQVKAYRLVDNKTSELSEWDMDLLTEEITGILDIDLTKFGFEDYDALESENPYSMKSDIPQYEPTGELPRTHEMVEIARVDDFMFDIRNANITDEEKEFLEKAATRHYQFNYRKIAEYYANVATPEMQELMEKSALVIIDVKDAIANGYAKLAGDIKDMLDEDWGDTHEV